MSILGKIGGLKRALRNSSRLQRYHENQMLLLGKIMAENVKRTGPVRSLKEVEFKVFSQFGEDGIIQWLVHHVEVENETFIEFGVEDYQESNTRFLMTNDNWSGLVMDGSAENMRAARGSEYYWRYDLTAVPAFIDRDNVNGLVSSHFPDPEVGLLSVDVDGNDYWVWKAIEGIRPVIVVLEYNSVFGPDRAVTIPYDRTFQRTRAHHSNLYFGASLRALRDLSAEKGYAFVGCNSTGTNAFFVRNDRTNAVVRGLDPGEGFVSSKARESRDEAGNLTYINGADRLEVIRGLPVYNTETGQTEPL